MELQIQDLVSSIRKEGVDAAQAEAAKIIEEAKKKAESIVAQANADAKNRKEMAEREIGILKEGALVSAEQAKRDAVLAFKEEVQGEFKKLLAADVKKTLSDDTLAKLIQAAVAGEDVSAYSAEVSQVTDGLKAKLAKEIKNGLEIKPTKNVQAGFRLSAKDGSGYFDCSDDEIMQMLMPYFRDLNF